MTEDAKRSQDGVSELDLYKLYLATAEKVSDRRASANAWMLSVNSAIIGLYGYLKASEAAPSDPGMTIWHWAIPGAGALVCLAWAALLASYHCLNSAKFKVLMELEAELPVPLFQREREHYKKAGRHPLSLIESWVPWTFVLLYGLMTIAAFST